MKFKSIIFITIFTTSLIFIPSISNACNHAGQHSKPNAKACNEKLCKKGEVNCADKRGGELSKTDVNVDFSTFSDKNDLNLNDKDKPKICNENICPVKKYKKKDG